jgi:hypothetical protein
LSTCPATVSTRRARPGTVDLDQTQKKESSHIFSMAGFVYRCPTTRRPVQGWSADDVSDDTYLSVDCIACGMTHFVNPANGRVLGHDDDDEE